MDDPDRVARRSSRRGGGYWARTDRAVLPPRRTTPHEAPIGATVEWYTPPTLFRDLGLTFDLDPASPGSEIVPWVPAVRHYTPRENGLIQPWTGRVWLNPPYGAPGVAFIQRLIEHGNGVLLVPSRTETRIFQQAAATANEVCFLRERLHFIRADGRQSRSSFASVLLAFGDVRLPDLGWRIRPETGGLGFANGLFDRETAA